MPHPPETPASPGALSPRLPSPLQELDDARFACRGLRLLLKRDDLIHPALPGNKWRKLAPNLRAAAERGHRTLLTFGGAYSNHLRATAAAGRLLGFATVGVVRGEELADRPLNNTLARCAADGMRLHFTSRAEYRRRHDPVWVARLRSTGGYGDCFVIPEGGSNALAVRGCTELGRELRGHTDVAAVACGTGGTLAGLAAGLAADPVSGQPAPEQPAPHTAGTDRTGGAGARALGVAVLRGGFLGGEVARLQREAFGGRRGEWEVDERFHGGGYARVGAELEEFAGDFEARHGLPPLDRLYVAKLLHGLTVRAEEGAFARGSTVTAVVTG